MRRKSNDPEVLTFMENLPENVANIKAQLTSGILTPHPYKIFTVYEPKVRTVQAPAFEDRIVHHAICIVIAPLFIHKFIPATFACISERGHIHASYYLRQRIAGVDPLHTYFLKADISKYFPHINKVILLNELAKTIRDPIVMDMLVQLLISQNPNQVCELPIGALTSQLLANIYLNPLDHHAAERLGVGKAYARYMDDFVIVERSKAKLIEIKLRIEEFLYDTLQLTYNPKTRIDLIKNGIDFAGYRHFVGYVLPRKANIKAWRRRFRLTMIQYYLGTISMDLVQARIASFLGYMKHCDSHDTVRHMLQELIFIRSPYVPLAHDLPWEGYVPGDLSLQ